MRNLIRRFDEIWGKADRRNKDEGHRFFKIFETSNRYITMGVYDSKTKRYSTFDTINLSGNFRYNIKSEPPQEFNDMEDIVSAQ
jgi:hypothetical protein